MQLEKICEVLAEPKYSGIKYVWYDYWCMPQGADKTPEQKVQFKWMLQNINSLYFGCHVLILLDLSYLSRFWTQFEAWLAMQTATKEGLRPASEAEQRWDVRPILNANSMVVDALQNMWRGLTPKDAIGALKKPDVTVTNESDKVVQLKKLKELDERVMGEVSKMAESRVEAGE